MYSRIYRDMGSCAQMVGLGNIRDLDLVILLYTFRLPTTHE
jgi:hypothetical protein